MKTTQESRARKPRKKKRFVVTKDGVDCRLASAVELGMSFRLTSGHTPFCSLTGKTGLLVKCTPDNPSAHDFASAKGAMKRADKTQEVAKILNRSMADELPKLRPLLEAGKFDVRLVR